MAVVVAIDAGTTGVRCLAVDERGNVKGWSYREFTQHFPRPGWVEHDANEIWAVVRATLTELVAELDVPVAAIGITNQRETVVAWDRRTGEPLARAIVWQDRRTADRCAELHAAGHLAVVRTRTGLVLDPYFSATKIEWLLRHGDIEITDSLAVGTIDSWLTWKLTGGAAFVTDPSNASRTMLYDIESLRWSDELLDLFGVQRRHLPDVVPTSAVIGATTAEAGVPGGVPIAALVGDQQSALFGQACVHPGMIKTTYGTGSFALLNAGTVSPGPVDGALTTIAWQLGDTAAVYALEAAIFVTGAAIQWLRDSLGIIAAAADIGPLAESVDDNGGLVVVPAFTGLGSPWWDPSARGTIAGITRGTTRAHLARAVVESIAFQTRDAIDAMVEASGHRVATVRVDGGASALALLLRLQADQLQVPVARPAQAETTALGAAYLAGLATGVWSSVGEIEQQWQLDTVIEPSRSRDEADHDHATWRDAVRRSLDWDHAR